ncbi:MAG: hypothetical protein ACYC3G_00695 [Minisyncoccota bacterium]
MFIYLICPVRHVTPQWHKYLDEYVAALESQGNRVHYPPRDVDQDDPTGYRICSEHREAMWRADEVHVAWDGKSEGCLFDLGMAFVLHMDIKPVPGHFPQPMSGKGFASMVWEWLRRLGWK